MSAPSTTSTQLTTAPTRRRFRLGDTFIVIILIALVAIFAVLSPPGTFLTIDNLKSLTMDASQLMILSAGMTLLLIAGGLDLSVGMVVVFTAVVSAKVVVAVMGSQGEGSLALAITLGVLTALAVGALWGLLNALLIVVLKVPSFIATLATLGMALGLAQVVTSGINVVGLPLDLQEHFGLGQAFGIVPWPVVVAVIVVALLWILLSQTRFGLRTYAIGANAESARRAGVNDSGHMAALYALMGVLAGIVAFIDIARFGTASLTGHTQDALNAISAVVIGGTSLFGGRGRMLGTVIGVLIPTVLLNGFIIINVDPYWQNVAVGIVLVAAVCLDQYRRRKTLRT